MADVGQGHIEDAKPLLKKHGSNKYHKALSIPPTKDPVLNFRLPPLHQILNSPQELPTFKYVKLCLKSLNSEHLLECYQEISVFQQEPKPTKALAQEIYFRYLHTGSPQRVHLPATQYEKIESDVNALKDFASPKLFDVVQQEIATKTISAFRSSPEFDQWLKESKRTCVENLTRDWWEKYKKTKWAAHGRKCVKQSAKDKCLELPGNLITKSCELPENRYYLQNRYCQVYWPVDDLTRVCHVLSYSEKHGSYQAYYFFDGNLYDEYFDSDWSIIDIKMDEVAEEGCDREGSCFEVTTAESNLIG